MSMFGLMETFFFISLGITFVLILLLVYHFKQRLTSVEQKSDTMFDIVNNMVKEMAVIKTMVIEQNMTQQNIVQRLQQVQQVQDVPVHMFRPENLAQVPYPVYPAFMAPTMPMVSGYDIPVDMQVSDAPLVDSSQLVDLSQLVPPVPNEDDDTYESEYDDEDDEDTFDGEDYDDEDEGEENGKVIVSDNEEEIELEDVVQSGELASSASLENSDTAGLPQSVELVDIITEEVEVSALNEQNEQNYNIVERAVADTQKDVPNLSTEEADYIKYSISDLRGLVMQKGLTTDASKMKKPRLLALLGSV